MSENKQNKKLDLLTLSKIFARQGFDVTVSKKRVEPEDQFYAYKDLNLKIVSAGEYEYFPKYIISYDFNSGDPCFEDIANVAETYTEKFVHTIADVLKRKLPLSNDLETESLMDELRDQYCMLDNLSNAVDECLD